jgi:hypothetical protein
MTKPLLTKDDLQQIEDIDDKGKGDRTGAYIRLWQLTASAEALRQARISSFSGGDGGAAFGANLELQKELGSKYPGVFNLSQQVFESSINNIREKLDQINAGANIDTIIFQGAEAAWNQAQLPNGKTQSLKHDFPGNLFAFDPLSSNWWNGLAFSNGSDVALEGAENAVLFGKSPADFAGLPGYSTHIVKDYAGDVLLTIKDDRTGKTVYVGTGGSLEQYVTDHAGINLPMAVHPGADIPAMRQKLTVLRQHEEPGLLNIDQHGHVQLISPSGETAGKTYLQQFRHHARQAREEAAKKPVPAHIARHRLFLKAGQRHGSFAPVPPPGPGAAASPAQLHAALVLLLRRIKRHAAQNPLLHVAAYARARGKQVAVAPPARMALPGMAPRAQQAGLAPPPRRQPAPAPGARTALEELLANPPASLQELTFKQQSDLRDAVSDYFAKAARLPPSGCTGFDPLLSPAWPGQTYLV